MGYSGVFVGLATLDVLYQLAEPPRTNSKNIVSDYGIFAGGPAANAAVTFAALGGKARLITGIGRHPLAGMIRADLEKHGVEVDDRLPERDGEPAVAGVMVSPNGDRLAASTAAKFLPEPSLDFSTGDAAVALVDGHFPSLGLTAARLARAAGTPVVADCGSWKEVYSPMFPYLSAAICSEDFRPPGAETPAEITALLTGSGVADCIITRGARPVLVNARTEVSVPSVDAIDTLGAGDVFHGAYCYYLAAGVESIEERLRLAADVAALSCTTFGTRAWIERLAGR